MPGLLGGSTRSATAGSRQAPPKPLRRCAPLSMFVSARLEREKSQGKAVSLGDPLLRAAPETQHHHQATPPRLTHLTRRPARPRRRADRRTAALSSSAQRARS